MNDAIVTQRQTKYCQAIEDMLDSFGHATNAELLRELRKTYSELSATTVHRATARLALRGKIAVAPSSNDGAMRYDTNVTPHDHFHCSSCDMLRDTNIKDKVASVLELSIEDCHISGRLTVSGTCKQCKEKI